VTRGRPILRARSLRFGAAVLLCATGVAGSAFAAFPQQAPNDPEYAPAEQGGPATCAQKSVDEEQAYLYGFMPMCAPGADDPESAGGMSLGLSPSGEGRSAWKRFSAGSPKTVIAYVEGGINWQDFEPRELADKVFLNGGELPPPTTPKHDGFLNAQDYSLTPDANGNGLVDPEDIIVRFSNGRDEDHNGYTDDISGWDFYDRQNDPATIDSTYDHANEQQKQAAAKTDNGIGEAGVCPRCMILPIKAGAEALDRSDDLAQAWLYAADMNADVIVSTTADLGYSSFMSQAIDRAWQEGSVMVQSSNDFDSTDHQGGMFHQHVLPGNGMVSNTEGLQSAPGSAAAANALTTSYRERSGYTSWGTHNVFTAATQGGTTSESTPTIGGVMGLVLSYGKKAAAQSLIDHPLTNAEAIQVVRATASDVNDPSLNWPNGPGWDLQYGYGRPNVYAADQAIHDGDIPPVGWIDSPAWYRLYDPTRTSAVPVTGHVEASRSSRYRYTVQFAPGPEPSQGEFINAGSGSGTDPFTGTLGRLDLSKVPRSFWSKAYEVSQTKTLETSEQYTVTIRLRVTDAQGRVGEDRRSIAVTHDASWAKNFPRRIGPGFPGGESQPALADLQGTGHLAIVFADSDGRVHALDGKSGGELPGFPVHTRRTTVEVPHPGIDPGYEPVFSDVAVGDLKGNGELDIVATSSAGRVYAWSSTGRLLDGWPKTLDRGVSKPPIPRPGMPFTRLPHRGATAPPLLYDLDGDRRLEVVQAAWDGHLYVWKPSGRPLAGWPVKVELPGSYQPPSGYTTVQDHKLDAPPAIGDIDGDGEPDLVLRSQYSDIVGSGLQPGLISHLHAYHADGSVVDGFPVSSQAIIGYYASAQEFITEGVSIPILADVDGNGDDEIAFAPGIFSPTYLYDGSGSQMGIYGPVPNGTLELLQGKASLSTLLGVLDGNLPADAPVNFTTAGAFGRFGGRLTLAEPRSGGASVAGSLLLPGSGLAIQNYETAYDAQSGAPLPGFPSKLQGLDFLGAPVIADVSGDGRPEIVNSADTSALQAFTTTGAQAPGFPKFTTGWIIYAPAVGDLDSDGKSEIVATTREGYLFVWRTDGDPAGNHEWWRAGHDEHNTDAYGTDTRPPGAIERAKLSRDRRRLTFTAPGEDWYQGQADHYRVSYQLDCARLPDCPGKPGGSLNATAAGGREQALKLPPGVRTIRIRALDDAGNRGPAKTIRLH
jgi:subtilase family protein